MKKILDVILISYLLLAPYFYTPHLLIGSTHAWGGQVTGQLYIVAIIRDVGLIIISLLYITNIILHRKISLRKISIPGILFLIYAMVVSIRLLLHGFSGSILNHAIIDSQYILSIFVILVFYLANWDDNKINLVKKSLKFASIPLVAFLVWEIANPEFAVWFNHNRYRSTMFSPTVLGQFAGFIFIVAFSDFINSKKGKLANLFCCFIALTLIFFSGSRTTLLVVMLTLIFVLSFANVKHKKEKISFLSIIIILISIIILIIPHELQVFTSRVFDINISGDGRLSRLIYEWDNMTAASFLFGSVPELIAPLDISWFMLLKRLGVLGFTSFLFLNISIMFRLIKKIRKIDGNKMLNYQFVFVLVFMSFNYLFTTNLMNSYPLNIFYWFSIGIGMRYIK